MNRGQLYRLWFWVGLFAFMLPGFYFGQSLERSSEYREVILVEIALSPQFLSTEEKRGISHHDVISSFTQAVDMLGTTLQRDFAGEGFAREVLSSYGLPNKIRLIGPPSQEKLNQSERIGVGPLVDGRYQFEPVDLLAVNREWEEVPAVGAPGWQLGMLGALGAGIFFSVAVVTAQALRAFFLTGLRVGGTRSF